MYVLIIPNFFQQQKRNVLDFKMKIVILNENGKTLLQLML